MKRLNFAFIKQIMFFSIVALIFLSLCACSSNKNNTSNNGAGNYQQKVLISHVSIGVTHYNGWVYFNQEDSYSKTTSSDLCKMKEDGSKKTVLIKDIKARNLIGVNGYIYFINIDTGDYSTLGIYKMKEDGTNLIQVASGNVQVMYYRKGFIYYLTQETSGYYYTSSVYSIKTDSNKGENKKIFESYVNMNMVVDGDFIYYVAGGSGENWNLKRMKLDGTNVNSLNNPDTTSNFIIADGWIYYLSGSDNFSAAIKRMKIDGTNIQTLVDNKTLLSQTTMLDINFNYINGRLYYSTIGGGIYYIEVNKASKPKSINKKYDWYLLCDKYIYYRDTDYKNHTDLLHRCGLNGENDKVIK